MDQQQNPQYQQWQASPQPEAPQQPGPYYQQTAEGYVQQGQPQSSEPFAQQGQPQPAGPYAQQAQPQYVAAVVEDTSPIASNDTDKTLRLIAFIFMLVSTVSVGWAIIPLAWMIPMTVVAWGIYKGTKRNTVAFDVCTLIFVSIVAGILLLVTKKD